LGFHRFFAPTRYGSGASTATDQGDDVKYEFNLVFLDRLELRTNGAAFEKLNGLGAEGWHIVHIKDDPRHERDLAVFMERQVS
jgi:hypothetical protein